jgi:hypothetical protein
MNTNIYFYHISLNYSSNETSFRKKVVEKIKIYFPSNFFFENRAVYEIPCKQYRRVGQGTDENMAHAHCMLGT